MAFTDSFRREQEAFKNSMTANCLLCIRGAAWVKTAIFTEQRAKKQAPDSKQGYTYPNKEIIQPLHIHRVRLSLRLLEFLEFGIFSDFTRTRRAFKSNSSTSSRISSIWHSAAPCKATTTISTARQNSGLRLRKTSRTARFIRFRATARLSIRFVTVIPSLLSSGTGAKLSLKQSRKCRVRSFLPSD